MSYGPDITKTLDLIENGGKGQSACSEVDNNVDEEDGVGDAVEHDPAHGEVIVEEGDGDRQDDQVRHQQ